MDRKPTIQSLERALDILDLIAKYERPLRSTEIAELLNLHKSTANNMIRILYRRGFLMQLDSGQYYIGLHCFNIGSLCDLWEALRQVAVPVMEELSDITGDNTILVTENGGKLITIASTEGHGPIVISRKQPYEEQLYCTASGKALLAFNEKGLLENFKKTAVLKRYTNNTLTDWDELVADLELTRKRGYSVCNNEGAEGVCAVGVPLYTKKGELFCILAQPFPDYYIATGKVSYEKRAEMLMQYAKEIEKKYSLEDKVTGT